MSDERDRWLLASMCIHSSEEMCAECRDFLKAPYPERTVQTNQTIERQPCGCQTVIETTPCAAHPVALVQYRGPAAFAALLAVARLIGTHNCECTDHSPCMEDTTRTSCMLYDAIRDLDRQFPGWREWKA